MMNIQGNTEPSACRKTREGVTTEARDYGDDVTMSIMGRSHQATAAREHGASA